MDRRLRRFGWTGIAVLLALGIAWGVHSASVPAEKAAGHARAAPLATTSLMIAAVRAGKRLVAVGEFGNVILSDDSGATWRQAKSVPTTTTLTAAYFLDEQRGWAVGHGGIVIGTRDGGENWEALAGKLEGQETLFSVWFKDAARGFAVGAFGYAATTTDGGKTWQALELGKGEDAERHLNHLFAGPGGTLLIAAESGTLFRSEDEGATWSVVKLPYRGSVWGGMMLKDQSLLLWGMGGTVLRSADAGKNWEAAATGTDQSLTSGVQLSDGGVVVAGLGGAVAVSRDDGRQFKTSILPDRSGTAAVLPGPSGQVLLFGLQGPRPFPLTGS